MAARQRNYSKIRTGDIQIEGLGELKRALKAIGPDAQKEFKAAAGNAAKMVARDARSMARSVGGVAAHVAPSIKPLSSQSGAGVSFGGPAFPMAAGAEFGAVRFKQFKPWRGSGSEAGYFIYPAIRQDADQIAREFTDALGGIIQRRFPE